MDNFYTSTDGLRLYYRTYAAEQAGGLPVLCLPGLTRNSRDFYAQIKSIPMLVIRGALSDLLSAATVERMASEKPDLEQLTVLNRGHVPLLDEPECRRAIDRFLARTVGRCRSGDPALYR